MPNTTTVSPIFGWKQTLADATVLANQLTATTSEGYHFLFRALWENGWVTNRCGAGSSPTAWAGSTSYAVGIVRKNGGNIYVCITAGTSAGAGGPTGTGSNITDNTVHWAFLIVDGTASNSTNIFWTNSSTFVNPGIWRNQNAHANFVSPDNSWQLLFQVGSAVNQLKIARVGSPGLNADATSTAWATAVGTGSDAIRALVGNSATPALQSNIIQSTEGQTYWSVGVQTVAPYGWYFLGHTTVAVPVNGKLMTFCMLMDPVIPVDSNDSDPIVHMLGGNANSGTIALRGSFFISGINVGSSGTVLARAWLAKDGGLGGDWIPMHPCIVGSTYGAAMSQFGPSLYTGKDVPLPVFWGRNTTDVTDAGLPYGPKGWSTLFRCLSGFHETGDLANWSGTNSADGLVLGDLVIPWPCQLELSGGL